MSRLHLFFPENDLALAHGKASYTPPPAAVRLRRAGATLPLWYGSPGDSVICDGVNAAWFREVCDRFGLATKIFADYQDGMVPAPWGWSLASRKVFEMRGVPASVLPTEEQLGRVRTLSHRRTAMLVGEALADAVPFSLAPVAREVNTIDEVSQAADKYGDIVVKLPWSSSGRGVIPVKADDLDRQRQSLEGALRRQGSLMVEPLYDKLLDFAVLYTMADGRCNFDGLSVFETAGFGAYTGNILAPTEELYAKICTALGGREQFDAVLDYLPDILAGVIGKDYSGPLGVDMMAVRGKGYSLVPVVEVNLRMTMGHVCHRFYRDHVVPGRKGRFTVAQSQGSGIIDCETRGGRIIKGRVDMAQPGSDFSFVAEVY
ncbi:MAG: hypothetical protein K1W01_00905 [Muribaculaceae bacterium]